MSQLLSSFPIWSLLYLREFLCNTLGEFPRYLPLILRYKSLISIDSQRPIEIVFGKAYGSLRNERKRNEMVLCEIVLCEMVLCEMITGNCKIYCKRKVRKQIKRLLNKTVPESLRICKLVANYKSTLVSNRNGFVFVSHGRLEVLSLCVRLDLEIFLFLSQ